MIPSININDLMWQYDRRVTELLEANNRLVEENRKLKRLMREQIYNLVSQEYIDACR